MEIARVGAVSPGTTTLRDRCPGRIEICRRRNDSVRPQAGSAAISHVSKLISRRRELIGCYTVIMTDWAPPSESISEEIPRILRLQPAQHNQPASTMRLRCTGQQQSIEGRKRNEGGERRNLQRNEKQDGVNLPWQPWSVPSKRLVHTNYLSRSGPCWLLSYEIFLLIPYPVLTASYVFISVLNRM